MPRAQNRNGERAAHSMPAPTHGRSISQHNALIVNAIDSDKIMLPHNGCCAFGNTADANGRSISAIDISSEVQVTAKKSNTQPMNRSPHDCNLRS